jgi:hypothetical protein
MVITRSFVVDRRHLNSSFHTFPGDLLWLSLGKARISVARIEDPDIRGQLVFVTVHAPTMAAWHSAAAELASRGLHDETGFLARLVRLEKMPTGFHKLTHACKAIEPLHDTRTIKALSRLSCREDDLADVEVCVLPDGHQASLDNGWGLFARRTLKKGERVANYARHALLTPDRSRGPGNQAVDLSEYGLDLMLVNEWRVLEANPILNPAAMFNDARGGNTKPNIMIDSPYIEVDMKGQCTLIVALVTTRTVPKGSELLGSYGDESFWMVREQTLRERDALLERIRTKAHKATQSMLAWAEMVLTKACEA